MANKLTIKRNDKHAVELTIVSPPTNLNGGTVRILVTPSAEGGTAQEFSGTISNNVVTWTLDGTLEAGNYRLEVEVTVGSFIVTAPSDGTMSLVVLPDLG